DRRRTLAPVLARGLAGGAVERVGRGPLLAGDAVDGELRQRAVVVVRPGLGHAVGIDRVGQLAVGAVHHVVIGVGLTDDAVIMDVVRRAVGVPGLGLDRRRTVAPDLARGLAVGAVERVGRGPLLAGDAVDGESR